MVFVGGGGEGGKGDISVVARSDGENVSSKCLIYDRGVWALMVE